MTQLQKVFEIHFEIKKIQKHKNIETQYQWGLKKEVWGRFLEEMGKSSALQVKCYYSPFLIKLVQSLENL